MERWPNFFIIGSFKAGTTTLYEYLNQTKGVYMSPVKDPNYFCARSIPDSYQYVPIRNKEKYLKLFKNATNEKALGEASALYLQDPDAIGLIHKIVPHARIIILLRDPVERAFSHYLMFHNRGFENRNFREAIKGNLSGKIVSGGDYVGGGMYYEQIQRALKEFGEKQVKIIIFEEFITNPLKHTNQVLKFLNVNSKVPENVQEVYNQLSAPRSEFFKSIMTNKTVIKLARKTIPQNIRLYLEENVLTKKVSKPKMNQEDRIFLIDLYKNEVQKLKKFFGRKLPWKNF